MSDLYQIQLDRGTLQTVNISQTTCRRELKIKQVLMNGSLSVNLPSDRKTGNMIAFIDVLTICKLRFETWRFFISRFIVLCLSNNASYREFIGMHDKRHLRVYAKCEVRVFLSCLVTRHHDITTSQNEWRLMHVCWISDQISFFFRTQTANYHTSRVHLSIRHSFLPKPRISSVLNYIVEN